MFEETYCDGTPFTEPDVVLMVAFVDPIEANAASGKKPSASKVEENMPREMAEENRSALSTNLDIYIIIEINLPCGASWHAGTRSPSGSCAVFSIYDCSILQHGWTYFYGSGNLDKQLRNAGTIRIRKVLRG